MLNYCINNVICILIKKNLFIKLNDTEHNAIRTSHEDSGHSYQQLDDFKCTPYEICNTNGDSQSELG